MNPTLDPRQIEELLDQADTCLQRGDAKMANALARQVTESVPGHAEAHYICALALLRMMLVDDAIEYLLKAVELDPHCAEFHAHLARAFAQAGRSSEAIDAANLAASLAPSSAQTLDALGTVYGQCNLHERALACFRRGSALAPDNASLQFNLGVALAFAGETDTAERHLETSLRLAPTNWRAYDIISRLRRQQEESNHVKRLGELLQRTRGNCAAQSHLHMAIGKEHEDLGDYEAAFAHFTAGKEAAGSGSQYRIEWDQERVRALIRAFPDAATPPQACFSDEPIFVIGMPRSGTTLVERIISSHPEVYSAGELLNFGTSLQRLDTGASFDKLRAITSGQVERVDWHRLGTSYLESTRPATAIKPRFIDKFPHNFFYLGFIAQALPRARIICLRRHPLDTCLSNFRESFSGQSPFHGYANNLLDTGRYFILFDQLMSHWKKIFPERVFEVNYEALVEAPETGSRALLDHCGLTWNDACLRFELNSAPSATASSNQVRNPIYRSAVHRWKKYGASLDGLRELLDQAGIETNSQH